MDVGVVAASRGQRETQRLLAGKEGAAGQAVTIARGPMAEPVIDDIDVVA